MPDLSKAVARRQNRISETIRAELEPAGSDSQPAEEVVTPTEPVETDAQKPAQDEDIIDSITEEAIELPSAIKIPTMVKKRRPGARKPDYSNEKTKRMSTDVPETVHKALTLYCTANDTDKTELVNKYLVRLLRQQGYLE